MKTKKQKKGLKKRSHTFTHVRTHSNTFEHIRHIFATRCKIFGIHLVSVRDAFATRSLRIRPNLQHICDALATPEHERVA